MRNILDIGNQGVNNHDVQAPLPELATEAVMPYVQTVRRFSTSSILAETSDGTRRNVEVHSLWLGNSLVFNLLWQMAPYEPIVYARQNNRSVMGILSPNYDDTGVSRLPSIKVLPLKQAYPLIRSGDTTLLPDAQMATMLAGSAHAEGAGVGGHSTPPADDFEHKLTFMGAVSLGNSTITAADGRHAQHSLRSNSSVATGLTNGGLGTVFAGPRSAMGEFPGYGTPLIFRADDVAAGTVYFPKSFLDTETAFGVHYVDAARIAYGATRQIMAERLGASEVSDRLAIIAGNA